MLGAETMWGLSAPVGKAVLASGIAPLLLTEFRMLGAAVLFWTVSLFTKKEEVSNRDLLSIAFASLLGTRVRDKNHHKKLNRQLGKVADSFGNITDI